MKFERIFGTKIYFTSPSKESKTTRNLQQRSKVIKTAADDQNSSAKIKNKLTK